jgi:hypothetical protein
MNFRYPPDAIVHRDHHHVDDDGYDGSIPHRGTLRISPCQFFGDDVAGAHSWLWVVGQEAHSPTGILTRHMPRLPRPIASITLLHRSEFDPGRGEFIAERGQYGRSWLRWPFLWKHHSSTSASQSMLPSICHRRPALDGGGGSDQRRADRPEGGPDRWSGRRWRQWQSRAGRFCWIST